MDRQAPLATTVLWVLFLFVSATGCKDRAPAEALCGESICEAGQVCIDSECRAICVRDTQCTEGKICQDDVCTPGSRPAPVLASIDGDFPNVCEDTPGRHCVATGLLVAGQNLEGAEFRWARLDGGGEGDLLEAEFLADANGAKLVLPETTAPGQYRLSVINKAGDDQQPLELLQGVPGPDLTADELVERINQASVTLNEAVLPDGLLERVSVLEAQLAELEATVEQSQVPHQPILLRPDGRLDSSKFSIGWNSQDNGSIEYAGGDEAVLFGRRVSLPSFDAQNLDNGVRYHMRYTQQADGSWVWEIKKPPYSVEGASISPETPPQDETSRYYDSNPYSMLVASVDPDPDVNAEEDIILLKNKERLVVGSDDEAGDENFTSLGGLISANEARNYDFEIPDLNWARSPFVVSAADAETNDDKWSQGVSQRNHTASRYRVSIRFRLASENYGHPDAGHWLNALVIAP